MERIREIGNMKGERKRLREKIKKSENFET